MINGYLIVCSLVVFKYLDVFSRPTLPIIYYEFYIAFVLKIYEICMTHFYIYTCKGTSGTIQWLMKSPLYIHCKVGIIDFTQNFFLELNFTLSGISFSLNVGVGLDFYLVHLLTLASSRSNSSLGSSIIGLGGLSLV